ncbi:unnamed protein product [Pleuronectes platessa]|uniref:Uncharacterized protein n=1 Tax=Pleuronectes platessa TaxID=8262 RepID=A0A9N7UWT4_PLEPL|nr:unnamed protein product [Pleuronectes platessa]
MWECAGTNGMSSCSLTALPLPTLRDSCLAGVFAAAVHGVREDRPQKDGRFCKMIPKTEALKSVWCKDGKFGNPRSDGCGWRRRHTTCSQHTAKSSLEGNAICFFSC